MSSIPITRIAVSPEKAEAIRAAVRATERTPWGGRLARPNDAEALHAFFSDPAVHAPIYSLPRPLTVPSVADFIEDHLDQRARGEGLLFVTEDKASSVAAYSDYQIWPDWAAGELGGGMRADRQGRGQGGAGAAASFAWMFDTLGLELICATAALDNIRTAKMLDHQGFRRMGEVTSTRPDGTTRASRVWEITAEEWRAWR